jgi:hypothetical protein
MSLPAERTEAPVSIVEDELSICTSWAALTVSDEVVNAPKESTRMFAALTDLVNATAAPDDVTETSPVVDVSVAPVRFENAPDPASVMFPVACIAAVGAIVVPPLIDIFPAELKIPEPEYGPVVATAMFPLLVVVWLPLTLTAIPRTVKSPAAVTEPSTDVIEEVLAMTTAPREVIGELLATLCAPSIRTVPALIPPEPVVTREAVLEIVRSAPASILAVPVVTAPDATSRTVEPLTAWEISTEPPLTSTLPPVDVSVAEVALVIAVDPEREMFPAARIAAVGATEVPPLMVRVPAAARAPEPVYARDGVNEMFPPLVVVIG